MFGFESLLKTHFYNYSGMCWCRIWCAHVTAQGPYSIYLRHLRQIII